MTSAGFVLVYCFLAIAIINFIVYLNKQGTKKRKKENELTCKYSHDFDKWKLKELLRSVVKNDKLHQFNTNIQIRKCKRCDWEETKEW